MKNNIADSGIKNMEIDLFGLVLGTGKNPEYHDILRDYLAKNPEKVDTKNTKGFTPLMLACCNSDTLSTEETVKILIEAGASTNAVSKMLNTALLLSCYHIGRGSTEGTIRILLQYGVDPNVSNIHGLTPLHYAVQYSRINIIHILLKAGANINAEDNEGNTPLMYAASLSGKTSTEDVVKLLVDHGADLNKRNLKGSNALAAAIYNQKNSTENTVQILIDCGADLEIDISGGSILLLACRLGIMYPTLTYSSNIVRSLIYHGADITKVDHNGNGIFKYNEHVGDIIKIIEEWGVHKYLKKFFSSSILKYIRHISEDFKFADGRIGQKITIYKLGLSEKTKEEIYRSILEKNPEILDYLNIRSPDEVGKLREYTDQ